MARIRGAGLRLTAWNAGSAQETTGITAGDWLEVGTGVVIGALAMLVAFIIAWRQRVILLRDRAADQEREDEQHRLERERHARLERRETWRAEYEEIRDLLRRLGLGVGGTQENGPHTQDEFSKMGLDTLRLETAEVARRGVGQLPAHLRLMAMKLKELGLTAVPEESEVVEAYAATATAPVPANLRLREIQRQAVRQDRIAVELQGLIDDAWQILTVEWGGGDQ